MKIEFGLYCFGGGEEEQTLDLTDENDTLFRLQHKSGSLKIASPYHLWRRIESVAPLTEMEFYTFAENVFALSKVKGLLMATIIGQNRKRLPLENTKLSLFSEPKKRNFQESAKKYQKYVAICSLLW